MPKFDSQGLRDWAALIVSSQDTIDRAASLKNQIPVLERRVDELKKETAALLAQHEDAKQEGERKRAEREQEETEFAVRRQASVAALEEDRLAREKKHRDGEAAIRDSHNKLTLTLRQEHEALIRDVQKLRGEKAELQRSLRETRDSIKV